MVVLIRDQLRLAAPMDGLEEEIESWAGFPRGMRKDDRGLWDRMVQEVRERCAEAVERSGKPLTIDPFFMALLLVQQRTIKLLQAEVKALGGMGKGSGLPTANDSLDAHMAS